jgi:hypothetical protein
MRSTLHEHASGAFGRTLGCAAGYGRVSVQDQSWKAGGGAVLPKVK